MAFSSYPFCGRAPQTVHCQLPRGLAAQPAAAPASAGYGNPPWIFKGRALYQLHLVKTEIAQAIVPKEFKLLEAFGYTLGGFFLASYEDSPPGIFDELVVIAGTGNIWNNPTSCAWAASVFVNSEDACVHGRQEFGLPSQVATFSKSIKATTKTKRSKMIGLLSSIYVANATKITRLLGSIGIGNGKKNGMNIHVTERDGPAASTPISSIGITSNVPEPGSDKWMGPLIKMSLPSFSGRTEYNPHLLKYSCQIQCRVRPVSPAKVWRPSTIDSTGAEGKCSTEVVSGTDEGNNRRDISMDIMLSTPILALEFNCLKMVVEPPLIVSEASHNAAAEYSP